MQNTQKITPFIWFEKDLKSITDFYSTVFPGTVVNAHGELTDTPSGSVQMASIEILGFTINLMAAGPQYPFTPAISFIVVCESEQEADTYWAKLSVGGDVLMEISSYDFAKRYGWVKDKYGISWQVMYREYENDGTPAMKPDQKIIPTMMFAGEQNGHAQDALEFYTKTFRNAKVDYVAEYELGESVEPRAKIKHAGFFIEGVRCALMDSAVPSPLNFNQAISFIVSCTDQAEVDYYWNTLTADGGQEVQCGWLNDKFGMPWQIVPEAFGQMMSSGTPEQIARFQAAFMQMKKFDIATLEKAFKGE